jgi:(1->4)-alpha-D-glucan 1-alpha-D-glucosylmutase
VREARPAPVSTYRLQLHAGFGFADAAAITGYLAALGVTHVYLSPILQAAPGSMHGYDVVDHSRVSADLGGEEGMRDMVVQFRRHGLGVIVDVVPNHMAIGVPESLNPQFWSVLAGGPDSPFARWFDVDWAARGGRLLLPILAGPPGDCLADITVAPSGRVTPGLPAGQPVLRYFDHVLPVRAGSEHLPRAELLEAQHYELADWHDAATELNWRRFFDITSLIAVRVEDPEVFEATHRLLLSLVAEGFIDGLRVDHPDGLADPRGYLDRLASRTGGLWVATEKILTGAERLPADWRCAGTTGYDALGAVGGLFIDPAGEAPLTAEYVRRTGGAANFAEVAQAAKRETAGHALAAEVSRLVRLLARAGDPVLDELSASDLTTVLVELLTAMPVYRAYVVPGEPAPPASAAIVAEAAHAARGQLPWPLHGGLDALADLVLGRRAELFPAGGQHQAKLIELFQQACGPVMAKGVEDTAFYRWSRLVALNEVGGDPGTFGVSPEEFHGFAGHLARHWPATMTTLSTHDTKRQEDVRARLAVLAEVPQAWAAEVTRWHQRAIDLSGGPAPAPDTEYLLWQTLAGAWPMDRDRLAGYLRKAMREAKTQTSWTDPDTGYESLVLGFADAVLRDSELTGRIAAFVAALDGDARANSLGAKLVQLTMPGVADVYQGCELAGFSLVDPDNRRPVDFARRRQLLAALDARQPLDVAVTGSGTAGLAAGGLAVEGRAADVLGAEKLLLTATALRLRRAHPDWFAGAYTRLRAEGPAAQHAVAFLRGPVSADAAGPGPAGPGPAGSGPAGSGPGRSAAQRGHAVTVVTRLPAGLRKRGGWADTALPLPAEGWRDLLTGATHAGSYLRLSSVLQRLPVALLVPIGSLPVDPELTRPVFDEIS